MLSESAYVCTRSAQEMMVCSFLISHIKSWYSQRSERRKFISQTENGDSSPNLCFGSHRTLLSAHS